MLQDNVAKPDEDLPNVSIQAKFPGKLDIATGDNNDEGVDKGRHDSGDSLDSVLSTRYEEEKDQETVVLQGNFLLYSLIGIYQLRHNTMHGCRRGLTP